MVLELVGGRGEGRSKCVLGGRGEGGGGGGARLRSPH